MKIMSPTLFIVVFLFVFNIIIPANVFAAPAIEWTASIGMAADEDFRVAADSNGNVYATGYSWGTWGDPIYPFNGEPIGDRERDGFIAKINSDGNLLWNTFLGFITHCIVIDDNDDILIEGDSRMAKFSGDGDLIWEKFFEDDTVHTISTDDNGNILAIGENSLSKFDSDGNLQWTTDWEFTDRGYISSMIVNDNGDIYVAGYSYESWGTPISWFAGSSDGFVVKFNSNGVLQWNTFLGSSRDDFIESITIDDNHNIYIAGESVATWWTPIDPFEEGGVYDKDVFIAKLDSNGVLQWNTFLGGSGSDYVASIVIKNGYIYVAGDSEESWGEPVILSTERGNNYLEYDAFFAKLNSSGDLLWHALLDLASEDYTEFMSADQNGNFYVVGGSEKSLLHPEADERNTYVIKIHDTDFTNDPNENIVPDIDTSDDNSGSSGSSGGCFIKTLLQ